MTFFLDFAIFFVGWVIGQLAFHGFEAHVSTAKRTLKFLVMGAIFAVVYGCGGRVYFYSLLGAMTVGMGVLHGYWFHTKHGIHWRKAEPREKYLQLIGHTSASSESEES